MEQTSSDSVVARRRFTGIAQFYTFYLGEHQGRVNRRLHFFGTGTAIVMALTAVVSSRYELLAFALVAAYGPAWFGHFVFEKNKPATFKYPFYSFACDLRLFVDVLRGKVRL